jgi:aryl carrier-like protein
MSGSQWQGGLRPKVRGTWNIHNSLISRDSHLDFFLLLSSVSGSVGTATESNYCAPNAFLDAFARFRRAQGKPAVAVGLGMISEVGYLHENADIGKLLVRKGIHPLSEGEFLQTIDLALSRKLPYEDPRGAHVLTGLEPLSIRKLRQQGFEITNQFYSDSRAALLANALFRERENDPGSAETETPLGNRERIRKHFSALLLIPLERLDDKKPIAQYGMDSMVAAELRAWFWKTFEKDVSFLELLSKTLTVEGLAGIAERNTTAAQIST